jgi:hypothetical protein
MTATNNTQSRLHWIKYNPTEWQGLFYHLSDAEYGLLHRTVELLWRIPGNRVPRADLERLLRIGSDTGRAATLAKLIDGQEICIDLEGNAYMPHLHEAFEDAVNRVEVASRGGQKRAANARARQAEAGH